MADSLDAHYTMVTKELVGGRVIPFLGAGVNLCGRPETAKWRHGQSDYLPSGGELADYLATAYSYPPDEARDLVRVAQYIAVMSGSGPLYLDLHQLFNANYPPTSLHRLLAALPALLREKGCSNPNQFILTTNYDDVLERAFQDAGEPFDLVTYIAEGDKRGKFMHWSPNAEPHVIEIPNEYRGLSLEERTVILKIHGAVSRATEEQDSYVITEDHYIAYLTHATPASLIPATLIAKMKRSHFLFLGYGLRDWNLRVILHRIWGESKLTWKSWAIQCSPDPIDQEFWRKRDVDILNVNLDGYIAEVRKRLEALPRAEEG